MGLGSQSGGSSGYKYNGSFAEFIAMGPVDTLFEILNGDTSIWKGPIYRASADADGKSILTTTIGTIHFYWGTATQNVASVLAALQIDQGAGLVTVPMSAFRNVCYAVMVNVKFGNQTTPPTLIWDVGKYP